jgi:metal-responsive CopG/Arc/MetJ family transcriptional regulator
MPRIKVTVPDELLKVATAKAEEIGKNLDELYADAIERYVKTTETSSAGAVRSRFIIPRSSPQVVVELTEELYQRAEKAAKRQGKRRHVLYADALANHLGATGAPAGSAFDRGHDLPETAWRPKGPT